MNPRLSMMVALASVGVALPPRRTDDPTPPSKPARPWTVTAIPETKQDRAARVMPAVVPETRQMRRARERHVAKTDAKIGRRR